MDTLFVGFRGYKEGMKVSRHSLAKWLKEAISLAYASAGIQPPKGIPAHSTRGAATSAAFRGIYSLLNICRGTTWASLSTFTRHYQVDQAAAQLAAFGRRVLQQVVDP